MPLLELVQSSQEQEPSLVRWLRLFHDAGSPSYHICSCFASPSRG